MRTCIGLCLSCFILFSAAKSSSRRRFRSERSLRDLSRRSLSLRALVSSALSAARLRRSSVARICALSASASAASIINRRLRRCSASRLYRRTFRLARSAWRMVSSILAAFWVNVELSRGAG